MGCAQSEGVKQTEVFGIFRGLRCGRSIWILGLLRLRPEPKEQMSSLAWSKRLWPCSPSF